MSLIHDALKRAQQARQQPPCNGQPVVPLQPLDYPARPQRFFPPLVGLLALASFTLSGWFFREWWRSTGQSQPAARADQSTAARAAISKAPAEPSRRQPPIQVDSNILARQNGVASPQSEIPVPAASSDSPVSAPPASAAVAASPTNVAAPPLPPSPFADLKLQSLIFREHKPAAVINSEMLFVGDEIRGARVLKIQRQSVTVERNGETNELRLPRL